MSAVTKTLLFCLYRNMFHRDSHVANSQLQCHPKTCSLSASALRIKATFWKCQQLVWENNIQLRNKPRTSWFFFVFKAGGVFPIYLYIVLLLHYCHVWCTSQHRIQYSSWLIWCKTYVRGQGACWCKVQDRICLFQWVQCHFPCISISILVES